MLCNRRRSTASRVRVNVLVREPHCVLQTSVVVVDLLGKAVMGAAIERRSVSLMKSPEMNIMKAL